MRVAAAASTIRRGTVLGLQRDDDTFEGLVRSFDIRRLRRARVLRRLVLVLLAAFVLAGVANVLGGRSGTVASQGGGYRLQVGYERVSRPGHDADWDVE